MKEINIETMTHKGEQKTKNRYTFKSIPRLLDMIEPTDKAKSYCQKLIDSLLQEGYVTDAKIVSNCLKKMNGEKVAMATMDGQKLAQIPQTQPKQEWGEEDEKMMLSIYQTLYDYPYVKSPFDDDSFENAKKQVKWLKRIMFYCNCRLANEEEAKEIRERFKKS